MKKMLKISLCLMLVVCVVAMCGCGNAIFNGNYQEATEADLYRVANSAADAVNGEELNYALGMQLDLDMTMTNGEETIAYTMDFKATQKDNKLLAKGTLDMEMGEDAVDVTFYYTNDYMYMAMTMDGETEKVKQELSIDDLLDSTVGDTADFSYSLVDFLDEMMAEESDAFKWYMVETATNTKVKMVASEDGSEFTVIYVYDKDYQLIAFSLDMSMTETMYGETITVVASIKAKPWSGRISLPNDLDTYQEGY